MNGVIVHEQRCTDHMKRRVLWENHQYAERAVLCLADIEDVVGRLDLNPLVIEHKVQGRKIIALSVYDPIDHFPDLTVDVCEEFTDEDFVVESGEVDGVRAGVEDCVYAVVFDSLRVVGMLF